MASRYKISIGLCCTGCVRGHHCNPPSPTQLTRTQNSGQIGWAATCANGDLRRHDMMDLDMSATRCHRCSARTPRLFSTGLQRLTDNEHKLGEHGAGPDHIGRWAVAHVSRYLNHDRKPNLNNRAFQFLVCRGPRSVEDAEIGAAGARHARPGTRVNGMSPRV